MRTAATGSRRPRIYKLQTIKILIFLIEISTNSTLGVHRYRKYPFSFAHRTPPKLPILMCNFEMIQYQSGNYKKALLTTLNCCPAHPIPPGGSPLKDDRTDHRVLLAQPLFERCRCACSCAIWEIITSCNLFFLLPSFSCKWRLNLSIWRKVWKLFIFWTKITIAMFYKISLCGRWLLIFLWMWNWRVYSLRLHKLGWKPESFTMFMFWSARQTSSEWAYFFPSNSSIYSKASEQCVVFLFKPSQWYETFLAFLLTHHSTPMRSTLHLFWILLDSGLAWLQTAGWSFVCHGGWGDRSRNDFTDWLTDFGQRQNTFLTPPSPTDSFNTRPRLLFMLYLHTWTWWNDSYFRLKPRIFGKKCFHNFEVTSWTVWFRNWEWLHNYPPPIRNHCRTERVFTKFPLCENIFHELRCCKISLSPCFLYMIKAWGFFHSFLVEVSVFLLKSAQGEGVIFLVVFSPEEYGGRSAFRGKGNT